MLGLRLTVYWQPENVVIDSLGYPKLIDFGLAKPLESSSGKTFTLCGTPGERSLAALKYRFTLFGHSCRIPRT